MKILIAATHPQQCTGYARVGAMLSNLLADKGHQIVYFGFQNLAPYAGRSLHKNVHVIDVGYDTGDPTGFGETYLPKVIRKYVPDVVILYNDLMLLNRFLDTVVPVHANVITYVDLVHDDESAGLVHGVLTRATRVWVFSDHWKQALLTSHPYIRTPIDVVPHAVDQCLLDAASGISSSKDAKKALGIDPEMFVVLNTNRNSYRKALDLSVDAFLRFWKDLDYNENVCLLLNNVIDSPSGYDIRDLVITSARRLGLEDTVIPKLLARHILALPNGGFLDETTLATMYVASDVGLNTCLGEGFGLCQLEGAALGIPQIATETGGLVDILRNMEGVHTLIPPVAHLALPRAFVEHCGTLDIPDTGRVARALRLVYDSNGTVRRKAENVSENVRGTWSVSAFETAVENGFFLAARGECGL